MCPSYPLGAKSYNKTKPIRIEEFDAEKKWWGKPDTRGGFKGRKESELTWKVDFAALKKDAEARAKPHWDNAKKATLAAAKLKDQRKNARAELKKLKTAAPKKPKSVEHNATSATESLENEVDQLVEEIKKT